MLSRVTLDLEHQRTRAAFEGLSPYLRELLVRAAERAHVLHADEVGLEHFLTVVLEDEESAAHQTILFGFADPDSMAVEALALSPGILVVGSASSLPFSPRGVRGLFRARELAAKRGASAVGIALLIEAAAAELDEELRALLPDGLSAPPQDPDAAPGADADAQEPVVAEGPLFASYDTEARRALGLACRIAKRSERRAISPAHILEACADTDTSLARRLGIPRSRVRAIFAGKDGDDTPPEPRSVRADENLAGFLSALPGGAGSLALLAALGRRTDEVAELLERHKITADLIGRARGTFRDPAPEA